MTAPRRLVVIKPELETMWPPTTNLAFVAGLAAALVGPGNYADAKSSRSRQSVESIESRATGEPILAIVSLRDQRITVYDANGWILRSPVSSGQKGRETPAGIFSVIQKVEEHYSNLYDDAYMPHMQRITWSGIALHGGVLPGYAASHGCIRMPFDFAARLFDETAKGMRVIVTPNDVAPVEIVHPLLFEPKPGAAALVAARAAQADEAVRKAVQAKLAAGTAFREATRAKEHAGARIAELQVRWENAKLELQPKLDAVAVTREAAAVAETARVAALDAAREVSRDFKPVSVLISRKAQRLYVRQAFEPIFDSPVTIANPDR